MPDEPTLEEQLEAAQEAREAAQRDLDAARAQAAENQQALNAERVRGTLRTHLRGWGLTETATDDAVRLIEADMAGVDVDDDGRFVAHYRGSERGITDSKIVDLFLEDRENLKGQSLFAPLPIKPSSVQRRTAPDRRPHELSGHELLKQIAQKDAAKVPGDPGPKPEPEAPFAELTQRQAFEYESQLRKWKAARRAFMDAKARSEAIAKRNPQGGRAAARAAKAQLEEMQRLHQLRRQALAKVRNLQSLTAEEAKALYPRS